MFAATRSLWLGALALLAVSCNPTSRPSESGNVQLLYFTAKWCHVCKKLPPLIDDLKADFPEVDFREVDFDREEVTAAHFKVTALPSLVVVKDGSIVGKITGLPPKGEAASLIRKAYPKPQTAGKAP